MISVKKCLCFQLVTGVRFIGWFTVFLNTIFALLSLMYLILEFYMTIDDIIEMMQLRQRLAHWITIEKKTLRAFLKTFLVILLSAFICFAVFGYQCIKGTKSGNHKKLLPILILYTVTTYINFSDIISLNMELVLSGLILGPISAYFSIVIGSLYNSLQRECASENDRLREELEIFGVDAENVTIVDHYMPETDLQV